MSIRYLLLCACLTLAACDAPPAREDWTFSHKEGGHPLRAGTLWVAEGEGWKQNARRIYADATRYVEREASRRAPGSWGVVLDLDQTVLDNVAYQVMVERKNAAFSQATWRDWVEQREATEVPGSVAFIHRVRALGGHVLLVTNRYDYEAEATRDNLAAIGVVEGRDYRVFLPRVWPDASSSKEERFASLPGLLAEQGFPDTQVIAFIGDVHSDRPDAMDDVRFFCVAQGGMYGKPCELPLEETP